MGLPVRRRATGTTRWPFVLFRKTFQAAAIHPPVRPTPQFAFQYRHRPVRLAGPQDRKRDGSRHHVRNLRTLRVGSFVRHHQSQRQRPTKTIVALANPAELQFQLRVLALAARLHDDMREPFRLPALRQQPEHGNRGTNYGWGIGTCVLRAPHEGVAAMLSPGSYGHGGAWGTQAWIDPVKGVAYILVVQRANFPNSDASEVRREFQKAAPTALVMLTLRTLLA